MSLGRKDACRCKLLQGPPKAIPAVYKPKMTFFLFESCKSSQTILQLGILRLQGKSQLCFNYSLGIAEACQCVCPKEPSCH